MIKKISMVSNIVFFNNQMTVKMVLRYSVSNEAKTMRIHFRPNTYYG
jgi:hypothetical protein